MDLPDTIIEVVRLAKMDKRHDHLDNLMKGNDSHQLMTGAKKRARS
jgi:hypothetical protein